MTLRKKSERTGTAVRIALVLLTVMIPFISLLSAGIFLPPQYGETYYRELPDMVSRLEKTEGKKIVIIGNSSVAFGINSALCEELLRDGGEDYSVCNFGLYGAIGTKVMLDLSKDRLNEGDIVVFAPELTAQTLSLYFSGLETWYAIDGRMDLFWRFPGDDRKALAGNYAEYVSRKYKLYRSGQPAEPSGIYAYGSFDGHGDMPAGSREYNTMPDGVDENNPIVLSASLFSGDFITYVNSFYADIRAKGVRMYYSFPPMNEASLRDTNPEDIDAFYSFVRENFDFPVISDPESRIMAKEFFYDTNFHLNDAGAVRHTVNLVNDLKNQLGNTTKTEVILPEEPVLPDESIEGEGDNSCAGCFTYSREGNYYVIDGLTQTGAEQKTLIVPYQVNGLYVKGFARSVFEGNRTIREITLQENITTVPDDSFNGCGSLKKIILTHTKPSALSVGYAFLNGTDAKIYIRKEYAGAFINDYAWGYYEQKIVGY